MGLVRFLAVLPLGVACLSAQQGYVFPSSQFDLQQAMTQLAPGASTIRGIAMAKENDSRRFQIANLSKGHRARPGTLVTLYPVTPYLEEMLALRKKHGGKASLSNEAFSCRVITWTNERGEFEFQNLKPGNYYLEAVVEFAQKTERQVQTGSSEAVYHQSGGGVQTANVVSTPIYATVFGAYNAAKLARASAEVTADSAVVTVILKN